MIFKPIESSSVTKIGNEHHADLLTGNKVIVPALSNQAKKVSDTELQKIKKELTLNPPQKFNVSRQIMVFNSRLEFVELELTNGHIEWQKFFKVKPDVFTAEEKRAWLDRNTDVALGSDAFFPFGDNIERAHKSGVKYVAQPGGSVRDDHVIETCNKYGMVMSFTGIRLFHH
jgi:AICAR transformylase/IMP cyclohydrolase PurH